MEAKHMWCLLPFLMPISSLYTSNAFEPCGNLLFDKLYNYLKCVNSIKGHYLCSTTGAYVGSIPCIIIAPLCLNRISPISDRLYGPRENLYNFVCENYFYFWIVFASSAAKILLFRTYRRHDHNCRHVN